jgi:hypothetical protein
VNGPFETEADARTAAVAAAEPGAQITDANRAMLLGAIDGAKVAMGRFDRDIVEWLARWEPATVAVIAGLITRAARGVTP